MTYLFADVAHVSELVWILLTYMIMFDYYEVYSTGFAQAFVMTLLWAKQLNLLKIFGNIAFYIRLLKSTVIDLGFFFAIFSFALFMITNALLILNKKRDYQDENDSLIMQYTGMEPIDAFITVYMIALGEFEMTT